MSDNKHGELWEVEIIDGEIYILNSEGEKLLIPLSCELSTMALYHAVLCVNACEGMSDEEVKRVRETRQQFLDILEEYKDESTELAEARQLLERWDNYAETDSDTYHSPWAKDTRTYLSRTGGE